MRQCFIVEEQYRHESMPLAVADQLRRWGHDVDLVDAFPGFGEVPGASSALVSLVEQIGRARRITA